MKRGRLLVLLSVASRVAVLLMISLGALWPTYLNLRYAYNNPRIVGLSHGPWWETFYRAMQRVDLWLGHEQVLPSLFAGTAPAPTVFGLPLIDPVVVPSLLLRAPSALLPLLPALGLVALGIIISGRAACSFACPASLLFTFNLRLRELLERRWPVLQDWRRALPSQARLGLLIGGSLAAAFMGAWVWQLLLPYVALSSELQRLVAGAPLTLLSGLLAFVLLADLLIFPGEYCRALCPLGWILGRFSRLALLRVKAAPIACPSQCTACSDTCDLWLDPSEHTPADCSLCGRCLSVCPPGKLSLGLRPGPQKIRRARSPKAAALLLLASLVPVDAQAHHYKGLPHYGYFDNYPQTPTEEFIATQEPWELQFTLYNFQGMQRADVDAPDDVQIFLVVYDLRRQKPFGGQATITLLADGAEVNIWRAQAEQESLFYVHTPVPQNKQLRLKVDFVDAKGRPIELSADFALPGEGHRRPLLWAGLGLLALIALMAVASRQARPARRRRREPHADEKRAAEDEAPRQEPT